MNRKRLPRTPEANSLLEKDPIAIKGMPFLFPKVPVYTGKKDNITIIRIEMQQENLFLQTTLDSLMVNLKNIGVIDSFTSEIKDITIKTTS